MFENININDYTEIFSNSDLKIFSIINDLKKNRSKNCARNSIYNLIKAWDIKDIDPENSIFRSLNAEEEARSEFVSFNEDFPKHFITSIAIREKCHSVIRRKAARIKELEKENSRLIGLIEIKL